MGVSLRLFGVLLASCAIVHGGDAKWWVPYDVDKGCTQREEVFGFERPPSVRKVGPDRYEITFTVKGFCDVTVAVVDGEGRIVRHLAAGVLGRNAPPPFQKDSRRQVVVWDGKDDLDRYVKHPRSMFVRVSCGMKITYHRLVGGASGRNLPGWVWGIGVDEEGVYVFTKGRGFSRPVKVRRFDHDGNYVATICPPPADLPPEKLEGMGYVEYEPGRFSLQAPLMHASMHRDGWYLVAGGGSGEIRGVMNCQVAVCRGRLFFVNAGKGIFFNPDSRMHYIYTDGRTDARGIVGRVIGPFGRFLDRHCYPRLAVSPDGKWMYMIGMGGGSQGYTEANAPAVIRFSVDGDEGYTVFVGDLKKEGADERHLNFPTGVACDGEGRVYVTDLRNNRLVVYSPEGRFLKSVEMLSPTWVGVNRLNGEVYVVHGARVKGRKTGRLTKLSPYPEMKEVFHEDGFSPTVAAVDPYGARPRLWIGRADGRGMLRREEVLIGHASRTRHGEGLTVWEDTGKGLKLVMDFDELAKRDDGKEYLCRWPGGTGRINFTACDPTREEGYWNGWIIDLPSGRVKGRFGRGESFAGTLTTEFHFDGKGYMHAHAVASFGDPPLDGLYRLDPGRARRNERGELVYPEVPYDYGEEMKGRYGRVFAGVLPLYRPDHHLWCWGFGVNQRGEIAVNVHIEFAPRMTTEAYEEGFQGVLMRKKMGLWTGAWVSYGAWLKALKEQEKKGVRMLFLPRRPGAPLVGGTVWTFEASGEVRREFAVVSGKHNVGVNIDIEGCLYVTHGRTRLRGGRRFLEGRAGHFGGVKVPHRKAVTTFNGTYIKLPPSGGVFLMRDARIPLDEIPSRPPDLSSPTAFGGFGGRRAEVWVKNALWMYAGVTPMVPAGCYCPQVRVHMDWFGRSYIPEGYRHSFAVVDKAGNLIMHVGTYGNRDSALGPRSKVPVKGGIAFTHLEYISGTDRYLLVADYGDRLFVLKIGYHTEERVKIPGR